LPNSLKEINTQFTKQDLLITHIFTYINKQNVDCTYSYIPGIINHIASSGLFQLLGHLSYCVYLIHVYVIEVQTLVTKEPIDLSGLWIVSTVGRLLILIINYSFSA